MSSPLRSRLTYGNVMSTVAAFFAIGGGTAVALSGSNTVFSDDITNGEVKNADVGANAIGGGKVIDNSLTGSDVAGLNGGDVADNSLRSNDVAGLTGGDVADNSLQGADLADRSIGRRELKSTIRVYDQTLVPAGGEGDALATCPQETIPIDGGGYWEYNSGYLSHLRNAGSGFYVEGKNNGHSQQYLSATALCLP